MYELNLRHVLRYVNELVRNILNFNKNFKIIVTADHGELLGERCEIGHVVGHNLPEKYELKLREVPWFEVSDIQKLTQWHGRNTLAMKFAKYFEMAEKRLKTRKILMRKVWKIRGKLREGYRK